MKNAVTSECVLAQELGGNDILHPQQKREERIKQTDGSEQRQTRTRTAQKKIRRNHTWQQGKEKKAFLLPL